MSRQKSSRFKTRKLTEEELLEYFDQSLSTLSQLANVYDSGYYPICLAMAVEVYRILTGSSASIALRGSRRFTTVDYGDETRMLNAMHKLVGVGISGTPPVLDFVADFQLGQGKTISLKFSAWWNTDIIYRANAAVPGSGIQGMPVNDSTIVPFQERDQINRRDFVALLRNKRGAHQDAELPYLLDELETHQSAGEFRIEYTTGAAFDTLDGTLSKGATIMAAMMRQIVHELLVAYGRSDPKTLDWDQHAPALSFLWG